MEVVLGLRRVGIEKSGGAEGQRETTCRYLSYSSCQQTDEVMAVEINTYLDGVRHSQGYGESNRGTDSPRGVLVFSSIEGQ